MWNPGSAKESNGLSDVEHTLSRLTRVARPGSLIFLMSDFRDMGEQFEQNLRQLAGHCDVFVVHFFDPIEADLPPPGYYRIQSGTRTVSIDTDSETARRKYSLQFEDRHELLKKLTKIPSVHLIDCATNQDPRSALAERFDNR